MELSPSIQEDSTYSTRFSVKLSHGSWTRTAWVRTPTLTPYVILGRLLNLSILSLPDCILGMIIASI